MISLDELIRQDVEEVLITPLLRQAVVSYARSLFYGGSPISSCDSSCRQYFRRLQLEGIEKQQKLLNMKYQLKPGLVLVHLGQVYNSSTMTDAIAEDYLSKFPKGKASFIIKEDEVPAGEPESEAAPKAVKPRAKKK
jgi:hypothetical protein